ncbi:hypothetical protein PJL70_08550 [Mycobacterium kansasii]|uniref:hypothetical protein n=1 Tax=Mycobacteroides abscessus TaxID=36809 RepID=UPI001F285ACA|nr:hypothetical protein [Mycobacteroides abscessus]
MKFAAEQLGDRFGAAHRCRAWRVANAQAARLRCIHAIDQAEWNGCDDGEPAVYVRAGSAGAQRTTIGERPEDGPRHGVSIEALDRAIGILGVLQRGGEDPQDFVLREYILDGWLHGYLPLDIAGTDPTLTTWKLGQLAEAHYGGRS